MTTPTPTPEEHRRTAEELLAKVYEDAYAPMHPYRVDMLSRATVHALLASGPVAAPTVEWVGASGHLAAVTDAVQRIAASAGVPADLIPPKEATSGEALKPTPRKRAAKKTTASKETPK